MNKLYEQVDFILSGGALNLLVDFLTPRVESALLVSPQGADLEILDAIGTETKGLILSGQASDLKSAFPEHPMAGKYEVTRAAIKGEWPWAVRIRCLNWSLYILLREEPDEKLVADLLPLAGLISLWQTHQQIGTTEERLSRLSYMILATKNTLASIFEPMPLDYYAAFLSDVLRESLFPRSVAIFRDDGRQLVFLEGDERTPPAREGLYSQKMLPPVPIVTRREGTPYEVVLPIAEPYRLFCLTEWDKLPTEETLNFMELLGNLASRALSINYLRMENTAEKDSISSGKFTMLSLAQALNALKGLRDRSEFLTLTADIFSELIPVEECLLVVWDDERRGYVPQVHRRDGIPAPFEAVLLPAEGLFRNEEKPFFDLQESGVPSFFVQTPWPEMSRMRYVFPFWDNGTLEGFMALSGGESPRFDESKLAALEIVAQFVALGLKKYIR